MNKKEIATKLDLLAEHRELMRKVAELRQWWEQLDELGSPRFGEMGDRLSELREVLATHFADEEEGGYLASALAVAPQFSERAAQLQKQHAEFLQTLERIIADLKAPEPRCQGWNEARLRVEKFLAQLRQHEAAENAIVQSAFGDDLGHGD